jgi:hypothetical protein
MGNTPNNFTMLITIVVAGLFPVGIFGFAVNATGGNYLRAAAITVVYYILAAMLGIAGKVWGKLENPLVDWLANGIMTVVGSMRAQYDDRYKQYLIYEHRNIDLAGLSTISEYNLEVEKVFVELGINPQSAASITHGAVPAELHAGGHTIWEYLKSEELHNLAIIGGSCREQVQTCPCSSVIMLLSVKDCTRN